MAMQEKVEISRIGVLSRPEKIFAAILSCAAILMALLATLKYGPGIAKDSLNYLAGARHIQEGQGFLGATGDPILWWPPLYSFILAGLGNIFRLDPLHIGRYLNALAFGLSVWMTSLLATTIFPKRRHWVYILPLFVALSYSMLLVSTNLITEPLFILLLLTWIIVIQGYLRSSNNKMLLLATILASLAPLLRYIGIEFIIAGVAIIVWKHRNEIRQGMIRAGVYGVLSSLPIGYWVIYRNYVLNGSFTGIREFEQFKVLSNLLMSLDRMLHWFVPRQLTDVVPMGLIVLIGGIVLIGFSSRETRRSWLKRLFTKPELLPIWAFALIHFLLVILTTYTADHFLLYDDRFQLPLYIPLLIGLVITFEELIVKQIKAPVRDNILKGFAILLVLWLVIPVQRIQKYIRGSIQQGVLYYNQFNHDDLLETEFAQYLQGFGFEAEAIIYTNHISQLYFLTGTEVEISPRDRVHAEPELDYLHQEYGTWGEGDIVYLIWFTPTTHRNYYQDYFRPNQLAELAQLIELKEYSGGILYQVVPFSDSLTN